MLKFKCALWLFWSRIVQSRQSVPISPLLSRKTEAKGLWMSWKQRIKIEVFIPFKLLCCWPELWKAFRALRWSDRFVRLISVLLSLQCLETTNQTTFSTYPFGVWENRASCANLSHPLCGICFISSVLRMFLVPVDPPRAALGATGHGFCLLLIWSGL